MKLSPFRNFVLISSLPLLSIAAPEDPSGVDDPEVDPTANEQIQDWTDLTNDNDSPGGDNTWDGTTFQSASPKVVTLGDSFSSGTGIYKKGSNYDQEYGGKTVYDGVTYELTYRADEECWRDMTLTPGPRYAKKYDMESVFLACKGAEVEHVTNQLDLLNAMYPEDRRQSWQNSIFILTLGGNNMRTTETETEDKLRIAELIEKCIRKLTSECHEERSNQISNFVAIEHLATVFLTKLASVASKAKIRIMGYPKLMQPDPRCGSITLINKDEANWIDDQCVTLNNHIQAAVDSVKASNPSVDMEFVEVYNYLTVGACGDGAWNRHVHDERRIGLTVTDASFHPSELGYAEYYEAFLCSV